MDGEERSERKQDQIDVLEKLEKLIDRSDKEVDRVYKVYRILAGAVTIILAVGIGTLGYVSYNSLKDMRSDMREEMSAIRARTSQEMNDLKHKTSEESAFLRDRLKSEQATIVADVGKKVNQRVEDEFNKENIQTLVNAKASERIDKIADSLIGQQIEKRIDPKIKAAEDKVKSLDEQVGKTETSVRELKTLSDFAATMVAAQYNDRAAFDQLRIWADDKSYPSQNSAAQAVRKILEDHDPAILRAPVPPPWRYSYRDAGVYKISVLDYIWKRTDIPKRERMQFLVDVMKSDKDLNAVEYAGRFFKEESKQQVLSLAYWELIKWWEEHKDEIK
jgi:hypothetical protein